MLSAIELKCSTAELAGEGDSEQADTGGPSCAVNWFGGRLFEEETTFENFRLLLNTGEATAPLSWEAVVK
jgi:hypothetical protein